MVKGKYAIMFLAAFTVAPTAVFAQNIDNDYIYIANPKNITIDLTVLDDMRKDKDMRPAVADIPDSRPKNDDVFGNRKKVKTQKKTLRKLPTVTEKPAAVVEAPLPLSSGPKKIEVVRKNKLSPKVGKAKAKAKTSATVGANPQAENLITQPAPETFSLPKPMPKGNVADKPVPAQKNIIKAKSVVTTSTAQPLENVPLTPDKPVIAPESKAEVIESKPESALKTIVSERVNVEGAPIPLAAQTTKVEVEALIPVTEEKAEAKVVSLDEEKPMVPAQTSEIPTGESGDVIYIDFPPANTSLNGDGLDAVKNLAREMQKDSTLNLRVLAYAKDDEENSSRARRKALSRALSVRSALIDNGVRSTRIEVRALGNKEQLDRVYIEKSKRK